MRACISAPMITLSAPLQGHVRGVIAADLKLDKFSDLAYAQRPGKHGTVIIFDSFGVLIAYPDFARLVASLRGHPSRPQLPEIGEIRTGPVGAVMRGWDGGDNYEGSIRDEDGRDYFFLQKFSQGDEFSGHSLLLAAEDDFVRNVRNLQIRGIIIALIGSGCFVPVVWIFGSRMSGSLKRITAQASGLRTLAPPDGVPVTSLVAEIHELGRIMAGDEIRDRLGASLGNAFGDNLRSGIEPLVEELLRLGELYPRVRERQAGVCAERQPPRLTVEVVDPDEALDPQRRNPDPEAPRASSHTSYRVVRGRSASRDLSVGFAMAATSRHQRSGDRRGYRCGIGQKPWASTPSGGLNLLRKFSKAIAAVNSTICASL